MDTNDTVLGALKYITSKKPSFWGRKTGIKFPRFSIYANAERFHVFMAYALYFLLFQMGTAVSGSVVKFMHAHD